jgi:hypothetical protein
MSDEVFKFLSGALHADPLSSYAVAKADLMRPEERDAMVTLLRTDCARLLAPGVFAAMDALSRAFYTQYGLGIPDPPTWHTARALTRQRGGRMGMPREAARFLVGLAERPLAPALFTGSFDADFPRLGIAFERVDDRVLSMTPAGQALVLGLPLDASVDGLLELARQAAVGVLGRNQFLLDWLKKDVDAGLLGERERVFADALLSPGDAPDKKAARRAPRTFTPPAAEDERVCRVDGWSVIEPWGDGVEALRAERITGHPYITDGDWLRRSSPLVWIDEGLGWARTDSRLYRLGTKA